MGASMPASEQMADGKNWKKFSPKADFLYGSITV